MLIGRKVGGGSATTTVSPSNATIAISGYAPDVVSVSTLFLNHFNETDASTHLSDIFAPEGVSWTVTVSCEIDTAQMKFGTASVWLPLDGSGGKNFITVDGFTPPHTGDWTYEGFVRWDADWTANAGRYINIFVVTDEPGFVGQTAFGLSIDSVGGGGLISYIINGSTAQGGISLAGQTAATWHHWALVRHTEGNAYYIYFDGDRKHVLSLSDQTASHDYVKFQNFTLTSEVWFDECRGTNTAVYTEGTIGVPSEEFSV